MLGYMNDAALRRTLASGRVVFFSRSRSALWTKGETSGHFLSVVDVERRLRRRLRCWCSPGRRARPATTAPPPASPRPERRRRRLAFLARARAMIATRIAESPEGSYTARLFADGVEPHRAEGRRGRRRDRAGCGDARRRRRWSANPPTCSTTCWCCSRPATCRSIASCRNSRRATPNLRGTIRGRRPPLRGQPASSAAPAVITAAAANAVDEPKPCHSAPNITAPGSTSRPLAR